MSTSLSLPLAPVPSLPALTARWPAVRVRCGPALGARVAFTVGNLVTVSGPWARAAAGLVAGRCAPPAAHGHPALDYVLVHEYGHTAAVAPFAFTVDAPLAPSSYGQTAEAEARAEAFVEWWYSAGLTSNPLAQLLADRYGWR